MSVIDFRDLRLAFALSSASLGSPNDGTLVVDFDNLKIDDLLGTASMTLTLLTVEVAMGSLGSSSSTTRFLSEVHGWHDTVRSGTVSLELFFSDLCWSRSLITPLI